MSLQATAASAREAAEEVAEASALASRNALDQIVQPTHQVLLSPLVSQDYENASAVIPISSGPRARQNRPPSSETEEAGLRREEQQVGVVRVDRDRRARRQPAADLAPRLPRVVGDHERRPPGDDGHDPGPDLVGGDEKRQRDVRGRGRRWLVVHEHGVAALEIEEHRAERGRGVRLHQRAMIVETNRLATAPASCGSRPRWRATA